MKQYCALLAVVLLTGCATQATENMTPVWQTDLPNTGVHMEVSNAELLSADPVYYAPTREDAFYGRMELIPAVQADGAPTVTFYGVTADEVNLIYKESIGDLYVDYDLMLPQIKLDYVETETADGVSYRLDTAYNFEFTVTTQQGSDSYLVISHRSDIE